MGGPSAPAAPAPPPPPPDAADASIAAARRAASDQLLRAKGRKGSLLTSPLGDETKIPTIGNGSKTLLGQ